MVQLHVIHRKNSNAGVLKSISINCHALFFLSFRNQLSIYKMSQFRVFSLLIVPLIINYIVLHVSVSISFMTLTLEMKYVFRLKLGS